MPTPVPSAQPSVAQQALPRSASAELFCFGFCLLVRWRHVYDCLSSLHIHRFPVTLCSQDLLQSLSLYSLQQCVFRSLDQET